MKPIYLDNNATTRPLPEVVEAMAECYSAEYANPASQHRSGQRARRRLEDVRETIAAQLGAKLSGTEPDQLIFTSGGTEANNLALFGLVGGEPGRVLISAIEHPSVSGPAEQLSLAGGELHRARVTPDGVVDVEHFDSECRPDTTLASVMLANNETGVEQPVAELSSICAQRDVALHTDAIQVVGKRPVDFRQLGVAALSLSAHKFHGPRGIGALLVRHGIQLQPRLFGGMQQDAMRPGTEDVALAVGMQTALEVCCRDMEAQSTRIELLRDRFEARLSASWPDLVVHGRSSPRLPNTSCVAFVGLDRQALLVAFDTAGVECSTGSACSGGASNPSPSLVAMGCSKAIVEGSLRFSLSCSTTPDEVDEAADRILRVCSNLRVGSLPRNSAGTTREHSANSL